MLISLFVVFILACLAIWVVQTMSASFGVPSPIPTLLIVIIVVFVVLYAVSLLGGVSLPRVVR